MRARYLSVLLLLLIPCAPVWAGADSPTASDKAAEAATTARSPRIVLDDERNEIHFVIDGKVAAVLDANGLRVRESIEYGGTVTDTGAADFDERLPAGPGEGQHE